MSYRPHPLPGHARPKIVQFKNQFRWFHRNLILAFMQGGEGAAFAA